MKCLNLGCGSRLHSDWTNLDLASSSNDVQPYDLREKLPFEDNGFDVVYHSHLLEHFPKEDGLRFLRECRRVLKPGGILRAAVPDLETIARLYLETLEKALRGQTGSHHDYDWMMLELYDQTVRERSGGAMLEYMKQDHIVNKEFVFQRMGGEMRHAVQEFTDRRSPPKNQRSRLQRMRERLYRLSPSLRYGIVKMFLNERERRALNIGQFRLKGEVHQWMYDRYSLARLLREAGFQDPVQRTPFESTIPNWPDFQLDTDADGSVYKPDSLYMEAVRPFS